MNTRQIRELLYTLGIGRHYLGHNITVHAIQLIPIVMNVLSSNPCLDGVPLEGNAELITLFAQSMNQVSVQGTVPFNIIEP